MNRRELLNDQDVVSVDESDQIGINHKTFTVKEILNSIFEEHFDVATCAKKWFVESVDCELLSPCKNWRKGKVKITLEFIPDEVESPLDEIRREMQQDIEN